MSPRCSSRQDLTVQDLVPFAGQRSRPPRRVRCERPRGHHGDHIAFVQRTGGSSHYAWWLSWSPDSGARCMIELACNCPACAPAVTCPPEARQPRGAGGGLVLG
ncbi:hypothetical protein GCM10009679_18650 [Saccharothrix algeriensis]|uniref:Uncharacterized protein n=1 Tax=Catellatospora bangladeshensis TaxID=310355 RepID=A0A8J3NJM4_9ACTN|nr:hypothetical protein Cba03nite_29750 [Catellatospora bangladeshensis]